MMMKMMIKIDRMVMLKDAILRKKTAVLLDFVKITSPTPHSFGQNPNKQQFFSQDTVPNS